MICAKAKTVTAKVLGGLGNQLFIYATARALALRLNRQLLLDYDMFRYDTVYKRTFLLDKIPGVQAYIKPGKDISSFSSLRHAAIRRLNLITPPAWRNYLTESYPSHYMSDLVNINYCRKNITIEGYWQSEKYFIASRQQLLAELRPPEYLDEEGKRDLLKIRNARWPTAVALRFFREIPNFQSSIQQNKNEYLSAIKQIREKNRGAEIFIFTEEPSFALELLREAMPFVVVTHRPLSRDAFQNLYLMTECVEYVIGVSSYHWWGAWLSKTANARVHFIQPKELNINRDYAPESWYLHGKI